MIWSAIETFRSWAGKRQGLLAGVLGATVETAVACVPGLGLVSRILGEIAERGVTRLANPKADVPGVKPAGQALPETQIAELNAWLDKLMQSYGGLLDRLETTVATSGKESPAEMTALVTSALRSNEELARQFDACAVQVRQITLSLSRVEEKLDEQFHAVAGVRASVEDVKDMLVHSPMMQDWTRLRQADPQAVQAVVEADRHFLAGRREEGVAVLVGLLEQRGVGREAIAHYLGLVQMAEGNLPEAVKHLEQAGGGQAVHRTLTRLSTAAGRGEGVVWRSLPRGFHVGRKYEVVTEVGRGGMASVYQAVGLAQFERQRRYAIKVPAPHLMADPATRERFEHEIQVSLALTARRHPNIVQTLGYEIFDDPHTGRELYGLVLEFVNGLNLAQYLARRKAQSRPLGRDEVLAVMRQVCAALEHAHGQDPPVLHRDVKPGNVMLTSDRVVKLMDFGIARVLRDSRRTLAGTFSGTPVYMPPEFHDPAARIDARGDVFLTGNLLLELLTFDPTGQTELPPGTEAWGRLIDRATSRRVDARPRAIKDFLTELEEGTRPQPAPPRPVQTPASAPPPPVSRPAFERVGLALPGSAAMQERYGVLVPRGPFDRGPAPPNVLEPLARATARALAAAASDGKVELLYWACGLEGREVEPVGSVEGTRFGRGGVTPPLQVAGPARWGRGTRLLPPLRHFAEAAFKGTASALCVFLTGGPADDFDDVKAYCRKLAEQLAADGGPLLRLALLGDPAALAQMEELARLFQGNEVRGADGRPLILWDHAVVRGPADAEAAIARIVLRATPAGA